jgi:uncharacterized protein (TIGR00730 family)
MRPAGEDPAGCTICRNETIRSRIVGMTDKTAKQKVNVPEKHLPIQPLSVRELHETATERVNLISKEFTDGFNFLERYPKSVTIFGGARIQPNEKYYKMARELGEKIATELNYAVFTGGGPGVMEAANRGAFEAGGQSLGLTIELAHHQIQNDYLTENIDFYYFFSRKVCMSFSAEAYIFFPGGYGTLDEFFEIITLVQTNKIERMPIILVGSDFWKPLDNLMRKEMLGRDTIDTEDLKLYTITDDLDEVIEIVKNAPVRNGIKFEYKKSDDIIE